jgi:hypothetical protein
VIIPRPETDALKAYIGLLISENKNSTLFEIFSVSKRVLEIKAQSVVQILPKRENGRVASTESEVKILRVKSPEKTDAASVSACCI